MITFVNDISAFKCIISYLMRRDIIMQTTYKSHFFPFHKHTNVMQWRLKIRNASRHVLLIIKTISRRKQTMLLERLEWDQTYSILVRVRCPRISLVCLSEIGSLVFRRKRLRTRSDDKSCHLKSLEERSGSLVSYMQNQLTHNHIAN